MLINDYPSWRSYGEQWRQHIAYGRTGFMELQAQVAEGLLPQATGVAEM